MKTYLLFFIAVLIAGVAASSAQSPAPEPDTLKEVKQTDPEPKNIPQEDDANYSKDQVRITSKQIPAAVIRTLESDIQYEGWETATIYKNKAGNVFTVEIRNGDTTRTFRFDAAGRPGKDY